MPSSRLYHRHLGCRHVPEQDRPCDECCALAEAAWESFMERTREDDYGELYEDWARDQD